MATITCNIAYIDLFTKLFNTPYVHRDKYDDVDSSYGLHDYTVKIELRNSIKSYLNYTFTKIFTKEMHSGYAVFTIVTSNDKECMLKM